jgi:hypothetical protein
VVAVRKLRVYVTPVSAAIPELKVRLRLVIWPDAEAVPPSSGKNADAVKMTTTSRKDSLLAGFLISKTGRNTLISLLNSLYC